MTYTGYLEVEVGRKRNKSVITNSYFDGVFKITRPSYLPNGLPVLTLIHVGGGYVDGDSYLTKVVVNESSSLALTTQASTKVYKSLGFGVTQKMNFFLQKNSEIFVKQDSLIAYKDARFTQEIHVYMSSSSVFSYCEIITPGWSEDGKPFQYQKVTSKMKIFVDGELKVFDHLRLQPSDQLNELMFLEGYSHIGTMVYIDQKLDEAFIEMLRNQLAVYSPNARVGLSMLSVKGMSIRILANSTDIIETIFSTCEECIYSRLLQQDKIEWRKC
jgi:urease accessory protein